MRRPTALPLWLLLLAGLVVVVLPQQLGDSSGSLNGPPPAVSSQAPAAAVPSPLGAPARQHALVPRALVEAARRLASSAVDGRSWQRWTDTRRYLRFQLLEAAGAVRRSGTPIQLGEVRHESFLMSKLGRPVFNRAGRIHEIEGGPAGPSGRLFLPPLATGEPELPAAEAVAAAKQAIGLRRLAGQPFRELGWFATETETLPAWRVIVPAQDPFGTWQAVIDARSGQVLALVDLIRYATGTGNVYNPNLALSPDPELVPLYELDDSGFLSGRITTTIDERDTEAYRLERLFDFATDDPRFIQT